MEKSKKRRFEALINQTGLDDFGASGLTFQVIEIEKGKIYEEYWKWVDAWDGKGGLKAVPSGYVIDDNGIWHNIESRHFTEKFKEIIS